VFFRVEGAQVARSARSRWIAISTRAGCRCSG
jgi:hypothetical protein